MAQVFTKPDSRTIFWEPETFPRLHLTSQSGFRPSNYIEDHMDSAYRRLRLDNLAQRLNFFPDFLRDAVHSGGFEYFQSRFQPVVDRLMKKNIKDSNKAAEMVSRSVAVIEACPYHSHRSPGPWVFNLPSAKVAKNYVRDVLVPKANKREVLTRIFHQLVKGGIFGGRLEDFSLLVSRPSNSLIKYWPVRRIESLVVSRKYGDLNAATYASYLRDATLAGCGKTPKMGIPASEFQNVSLSGCRGAPCGLPCGLDTPSMERSIYH